MTSQTIICGLALMVIGIYGYLQGEESADKKNAERVAAYEEAKKADPNAKAPELVSAKTALIPAAFGGVLILCGALVLMRPTQRKHIMHFAAMVGVLGAIGGFVPIMRAGVFDLGNPAVRNGLLMTVVCVVFVVLCVQSFIEARKARKAGV